MKNAVEFLRDLVEFLNSRSEVLNEGKSVKQLTDEFMKQGHPNIDLYFENRKTSQLKKVS